MNQLIPIHCDDNDTPTILGRELHSFLEVETPYRLWFPRMCEYGFAEHEDYTPYNFVHPQNKQETQDHQLTISMAKEISMLQRTEKGKLARQYFIKIQEAWNKPEMVMARALKMADKQVKELAATIEEQKPLVRFAETCQSSNESILIRELAKICSKNKKIGQNSLFRELRKWGLLNSRNEPYQRYIDKGYFEVIERPIHTNEGILLKFTPKVLPKGQRYIINRLSSHGAVSAAE